MHTVIIELFSNMDPDDDHFDHYDLERIEMVQDMIEHW
jgi:hypothetical protein